MSINPGWFIDELENKTSYWECANNSLLPICQYSLICREKIINPISRVRFIRATDASAICTWLFIGTAEKCCQVLIDLEAQKNLLKNHIFVICLLETSSNPFYKTYFRKVSIFWKTFTFPKYFLGVNYMDFQPGCIRTKLFSVTCIINNYKTASVLNYYF